MQGGDGAARDRPEQRELKLIDMEVQDVEIVGALAHAIEHQHVIGNRIADAGVEPQRLGHAGNEIGRRDRIAARKQRHFVAKRHQFFGQIGDDPLGAAIKPWWNALHQRRDLRDFHSLSSGDSGPQSTIGSFVLVTGLVWQWNLALSNATASTSAQIKWAIDWVCRRWHKCCRLRESGYFGRSPLWQRSGRRGQSIPT